MTGSAGEVFSAFLKLGLTSFGGPVAHLGYFRDELVTRRRWIDEAGYADLVALCQFLPGPASSQVGFGLGVLRAGLMGGLAAFVAFTLPSATLMVLFAVGAAHLGGPVGEGLLHGLKLVAVAVVAQAVWGMARALTPDAPRLGIALLAALVVGLAGGAAGQVGAMVLGAVGGVILCRGGPVVAGDAARFALSRRAGWGALSLFAGLLVGLPVVAAMTGAQGWVLAEAFYRSGALVFGGGHVVLPLLETALVETGHVGDQAFLAGYGAAQAVPGPLFSLAAYLGYVAVPQPMGVAGALVSVLAMFAPGLLLVTGVLPFWTAVKARPRMQAAMKGANAAVVGVLAAALIDPIGTGAIGGGVDLALAGAGFGLLTLFKWPPWLVVGLMAVCGVGLAVV